MRRRARATDRIPDLVARHVDEQLLLPLLLDRDLSSLLGLLGLGLGARLALFRDVQDRLLRSSLGGDAVRDDMFRASVQALDKACITELISSSDSLETHLVTLAIQPVASSFLALLRTAWTRQ